MTNVDILIMTALQEEFDAARAVGSVYEGPGRHQWQEHRDGSTPYETIEITGATGAPLSIALARPTRMGGRATGPMTTTLTERLNPQCLAMSGVCAGNPNVVALGDVVIAEMVYEYDEGKQTATNFIGDHRQLPMNERWIREAQEFSPEGLASHGRATTDEARFWFLERLLVGDEPRTHPARARYFPERSWRPSLDAIQSDGLISRSGPGWALTDEGRTFIERRLYDDVDGPDRLPFDVVVAPMASGSSVVKDGLTWGRLSEMGVRTVAAVEMEAATIATVAQQLQVPHWLVVKGVMDHADSRKDDRYKRFAAQASAEVLYSLLHRLATPRIVACQQNTSPPSTLVITNHGTGEQSSIAQSQIPSPTADLPDLADEHRLTLQVISDMFRQHDSWPAFNLIDRPLRRHGVDAAASIMSMPAGYMSGRQGHARPLLDEQIQLTLQGLSRSEGAENDVDLFLEVTRWAATLDDEFDPGGDPKAVPRITSQDVARQFKLPGGSRALRRLHAMLQVQRWGFGSGGGQVDDWWWEIDREIQRFAAVTTADDYSAVRTAWVAESAQTGPAPRAVAVLERPAPVDSSVTVTELLNKLASKDPVPDAESRVNGRLYMIVSPRTAPADVLGPVCTQSAVPQLDAAVQRAIAARANKSSFSPDFGAGIWRRSSDGMSSAGGIRGDGTVSEDSLLVLTVRENGAITILCGRATAQTEPVWRRLDGADSRSTRPVIFPSLVLGLVHSALALAADLAQRHSQYKGQWDIGLRLNGIRHAIAYEYVQNGDEDIVLPHDDNVYERTAEATTSDLAANSGAMTERLVAPLLRALSMDRKYLPYSKV